MNTSTTNPTEALRQWLLARNPEIGDLDEDTRLLDGALVDSMHFVELLVYLEELRGDPIEADEMELENFSTLKVIVATFFPDPAAR